MIKADLHVHSYFSSDSEEPLENAVKAAVSLGLKTLCVTEHMDMDFPTGEFFLDTPAYKTELFQLKEKYSDKIELLYGVELGLMEHLAARLYEYTANEPFDFIIGSSHLVDGMDPYEPEFFGKYGDRNGVLRYFESILANISVFDDFDVYGHLDYAVRYCKAKSYKPAEYMELIEEILKKLIGMGKGIELNTAGLKYGLGWAHPHPDVLKRYRELGGEIITVGSDGHKGEHIAYDFDKAVDILKAAGFKYHAVFRHRKAEFIKL